MIYKIGDVNIAGPGWRVAKKTHKNNFDFTASSSSTTVCLSEDDETTTHDITFQIYALGGCDLGDIFERRIQALEAELALANSSNGHIIYKEKIDTYEYRREIVAGKLDYNEFYLQLRRKPKYAAELSIRIRNSRILETVTAKAAQATWAADVYKAVMVMSLV